MVWCSAGKGSLSHRPGAIPSQPLSWRPPWGAENRAETGGPSASRACVRGVKSKGRGPQARRSCKARGSLAPRAHLAVTHPGCWQGARAVAQPRGAGKSSPRVLGSNQTSATVSGAVLRGCQTLLLVPAKPSPARWRARGLQLWHDGTQAGIAGVLMVSGPWFLSAHHKS